MVRLSRENFNGFVAICGFQDPKSGPSENGCFPAAHHGIVFDEQDGEDRESGFDGLIQA